MKYWLILLTQLLCLQNLVYAAERQDRSLEFMYMNASVSNKLLKEYLSDPKWISSVFEGVPPEGEACMRLELSDEKLLARKALQADSITTLSREELFSQAAVVDRVLNFYWKDYDNHPNANDVTLGVLDRAVNANVITDSNKSNLLVNLADPRFKFFFLSMGLPTMLNSKDKFDLSIADLAANQVVSEVLFAKSTCNLQSDSKIKGGN